MQKLKLANGTFLENVQEINDYQDRDILNQDFRRVLNITVSDTDFETIHNTFSNLENLISIEIYTLKDVVVGINETTNEPIVEQQYLQEGLQNNFTILNRISANVQKGTFTVQLHQKSTLEQKLEETQLAIAELGVILGGAI